MEPCAEWEGGTLLDVFMTNRIADHKPRALTGRVECKREGNVMTVQSGENLDSIFKKLSTENFLSAPVCRGSQLVGQITLVDLVRHVNGLFFGCDEDDWIDWWDKQLSFQLTPASMIMAGRDEFARNPYPSINENFTSFFALELMARDRVHSVFSTDDQGKLNGILTQSMLISFLRQNKVKWPEEFRNMLVSDFHGMTSKWQIQTVREDSLAINAFLKMEDFDLHGLPVVDSDGVLTDCISVRDLRGVGTDGSNFARLYQPIHKFKDLVREEHRMLAPTTHYSLKRTPVQAVYVTPDDTMEDVLAKMDDGNLHRIFICNKEAARRGKPKPIGVISQRDVLFQCLLCLTDQARQVVLTEEGRRTGTSTAQPRMSGRKISPKSKVAPQAASKVSPKKGAAARRSIPIE